MTTSSRGDSERKRRHRNGPGHLSKKVKVTEHAPSQSNHAVASYSGAAHEGPAMPTAFSLQEASDASTKSWSRKRGDILGRVEITDPSLALQDKLTSEEGQLEENPYYTPEQAREAAKREYNRRNAARGRIRRKCLLNELQDKCASMDSEMQALKKENAALKEEIEQMKQLAGTRSLTGNTGMINNNLEIPEQGRMLYLPRVTANEMILHQRDQMLSHQSVLNTLLHQRQSMLMGGLPTTSSSQLGIPMDTHLQQQLVIARARAALNSNIDSSALPDLRGYPSNNLPK